MYRTIPEKPTQTKIFFKLMKFLWRLLYLILFQLNHSQPNRRWPAPIINIYLCAHSYKHLRLAIAAVRRDTKSFVCFWFILDGSGNGAFDPLEAESTLRSAVPCRIASRWAVLAFGAPSLMLTFLRVFPAWIEDSRSAWPGPWSQRKHNDAKFEIIK